MDNIAKGLGTYSFDIHLRALRRNFMTDFLLSRWLRIGRRSLLVMTDEQKYQRLNRMLAGFWFVGAHTDCDRLIAEIAPGLGVPPTAPRRNTAVELQAQTGWRLLTSDFAAAGYAPRDPGTKSTRPSFVGALERRRI